MNSERHLLLGLLAFQNGFITQPQLLVAFGGWVSDKSRGLADFLVEQKALSTDVVAALERMVDLHLVRYGGDPKKSLASLSGAESSLRTELEFLAAGDLEALHTVSHLPSGKIGTKPSHDTFGTFDSKHETNSECSRTSDNQRFRIVKEYARGGLGVVFVAEDLQLRREVAFKQIRDDRVDFEEYRAKFHQEAEITGQLEHPSIVPVYALGVDEIGRPYYAMRFIRGEDLQSRIRKFHSDRKEKNTQLDCSELRGLLRRFVDVCNAIDYAHDRGVLHRDLKPGNIMLGKHGETLVVDWGLAKPMSAKSETDPYSTIGATSELPIPNANSGSGSETRYGQFVGTPAYAPPEQMLGQLDKLGPASDVYSLGAILYELLTGKVPISGKSIEELITKSTSGDFPSPRKMDRKVPKQLDAICRKAMSLKVEDRYQSTKALARDIIAWNDDEPVEALRTSLLEPIRREFRKHGFALSMSIGLACTNFAYASQSFLSVNRLDAVRNGYEDYFEDALNHILASLFDPYLSVPLFILLCIGAGNSFASFWLVTRWPRRSRIKSFRVFLYVLLISSFTFQSISISDQKGDAELFVMAIPILSLLIASLLILKSVFRFSLLKIAIFLFLNYLLNQCSVLPVKRWAVESFSITGNGMAPTIVGAHHNGKCEECGGATIVPHRNGSKIGIDDMNTCPFCVGSKDLVSVNAPPPGMLSVCVFPDCGHSGRPFDVNSSVRFGDRVLVNKMINPRRWDIIVFQEQEEPPSRFSSKAPQRTLIARIAGMPGEIVEIENGKIRINDSLIACPVAISTTDFNLDLRFGAKKKSNKVKLASNEFFVVSDFAKQAVDSRFFGPVPRSRVIGVITHRIYPLYRFKQFRGVFDDSISIAEAKSLNSSLWILAKSKSMHRLLPISALEIDRMRQACDKHPSWPFLNTLGAAYYRFGDYKRAIHILNISRIMYEKEGMSISHPSDLAFLALSYFRLHETENALKFRDLLLEAAKHDQFLDDLETKSLLEEVEFALSSLAYFNRE